MEGIGSVGQYLRAYERHRASGKTLCLHPAQSHRPSSSSAAPVDGYGARQSPSRIKEEEVLLWCQATPSTTVAVRSVATPIRCGDSSGRLIPGDQRLEMEAMEGWVENGSSDGIAGCFGLVKEISRPNGVHHFPATDCGKLHTHFIFHKTFVSDHRTVRGV
ncbi:uncharacterized protein [Panulirus ornatus]|uniref:uncharacterized protein isoform X2 n=1 Tax=Panulirus ornatus TaxID=150431 RepID=UPI003A868B03